jgi:structure-specific endonuclease subunit SLX1
MEEEVTKSCKRKPCQGPFFCYIICNASKRTYVGSTNDLRRRLRQHNGEIKGGAWSTKGKGPWSYLLYVQVNEDAQKMDHAWNLSLEWHLKRPNGRSRSQPRGIEGRMETLYKVFEKPKFKNNTYTVFCASELKLPTFCTQDKCVFQLDLKSTEQAN